jgi:2-phospho-L-lactate guanylyltransferase
MSGTLAILPVKAFNRAKSRLAPVLSAEMCENLARHMATDAVRILTGTSGIDRVLIVGQGREQAELASRFACEYASDEPALDISANLSRIVLKPDVQAAKQFLIVPADLPCLCSADYARILNRHEGGVTICRAARDRGTNAFLATSPVRMTFRFGSGSATRHARAARAAGLRTILVDDLGFSRDIDTPEDLQWLCRQEVSSDTATYLRTSGIAALFAEPALAAAAV